MPWVRLDEEFPDHPKVVTAGPLAGWLHVCALAYCNRYLTDGFVARAQVRRLADFENIVDMDEYEGGDVRDVPDIDPYKLAAKLVRVGMWEECQGGYRLHNYHEYQPSRAEIEAQRKVKSDAGKLGGQKSGRTRRSKPEAEGKQTPNQNGSTDEAESKQNGSTPPSRELHGLLPGRMNPDPVPDPFLCTSLPPPTDLSKAGAEEEDHHGQGPSPTDEAHHVAQLVAERRWAKLSVDRRPPEGIRRERWLETTAANLLAGDSLAISEQLEHGVSVAAIVDLIEPPDRPAAVDAAPWRDWSPEPVPNEAPASVEGLAVVRSALGGGA